MKEKINRREFIKKSIIMGGMSVIGKDVFVKSLSKKYFEYPDIVIIKGANPFEMTTNAIGNLGGIDKFVKKNSTVGLLINSPWKHPGCFTNPDVAIAVVKICNDLGVKDIYLIKKADDSYWERSNVYSHYKDMLKTLKYDDKLVDIEITNGIILKKAEVRKRFLECDYIVNIPIAKHHRGSNFTGNLKNFMGASTHSTNKFFHDGPNGEEVEFMSHCIVDLNLIRKTDLCILDTTKVIIDNGPAGPGTIVTPNAIVAGRDPIATDICAIKEAGFDLNNIPKLKYTYEHGIGNMNLDNLIIKNIII
ncbi:MAG: DUF362 domain-containing protein [Ignavibacteriales bacterium]|nr:DUF362 domain-containing protein [Ignavibacteriales bacterium]